jgi:hypothetical protein
MQLKQYKLRGQRSPGRKRTLDYDVECPLCGFNVRRNVLRRGYVKPFVSGENYLPNGAAPENWTVTSPVSYYWDANVFASRYRATGDGAPDEADHVFYFPQLDKSSDNRIPPGQNYWPGIVYARLISTNYLQVAFGNPTDTFSGYCTMWVYATEGSLAITTPTGAAYTSNVLPKGWHRFTFAQDFSTGTSFYIKMTYSGDNQAGIGFGGAMATTTNDPTATLPHRSSALGSYTTGGMMPLCPSCYSGLRRRVPWE